MAPIDPTDPRTIAIALGIVVGLALLVGGATGTTAFGSHNPDWDGTSELRSIADDGGTEIVVAEETTAYDDIEANGTVAIVTRPGEYQEQDLERLRGFLDRGGTLVVAARDEEIANPLVESLGGTARIDGAPLRDDREAFEGPDLPIVTNTTEHPYVVEADGLALNHGTAIDPGNATVLARSSEFSYLDRAGDGEPSGDEQLGARPVIVIERVGSGDGDDSADTDVGTVDATDVDGRSGGELVLVSDPSVFINAMLERDGNRGFATGLLDAHDRVLLDQTARGVPPLISALLAVQHSGLLAIAVGAILLGGVLAWERRVPSRLWADERHASTEPVRGPIGARTSETDDRRAQRSAQGVMNDREQGNIDDRRG